MVAQGDLSLLEPPNGKRRPVLVVSRSEVIPVLREVVVAPITSTIRTIPSTVAVGPDEGIDHDSVATIGAAQQGGGAVEPGAPGAHAEVGRIQGAGGAHRGAHLARIDDHLRGGPATPPHEDN